MNQNSYKPDGAIRFMKKAVAVLLFLLISYLSASQIEVTAFLFDPEQPQPGDTVTISIRLTNKSYDINTEITCRLFVNGELFDVKVVPVDRRSACAVTFTWVAIPGDHVFSLEMSYYVERTEMTDTFSQSFFVAGTEEEIDYFSKALSSYEAKSYLQAKILFEQAKYIFEQENDIEKATECEEYIQECDQYIEAAQVFDQAEKAYQSKTYDTALTYYQQAQSLYKILNDERAVQCEEKIQEINEYQRKQAEPPYYLYLSLPVVAAVIAFIWLKRRKPPPPLPDYVPEKRREEKPKGLFMEANREKPEIGHNIDRIESGLDTEDVQTFKSLVRELKKQEIRFDEKEHSPEEAAYIKERLDIVKERVKEKGKRLQDMQKLKELEKKVDILLDEPVGELVDAYNKYAQLHNAFDQIPHRGLPQQDKIKSKLDEYYQFIQLHAKSE